MDDSVVEGADARFYRRLLDLGECQEPTPLLDEALEALLAVTEAREAYIQLVDGDRRWEASRGCDGDRVEQIKQSISQGIIAQALESGETVQTASAVTDPRFGDLESVRRNAIEAVVCAPLGRETPLGVVYLQGGGLGRATADSRRQVSYFARAIAPFAENLLTQRGSEASGPGPFAPVVYASPRMHEVVERCRFAAALDVQLLITGPTGTGKTLMAECIHRASPRADGPFVGLNCAAIPEALVENELFGADTGGHSAARGGVIGKVTAASGGTLFLDEIAELSLGAQAKLLQLLQSKTYHRLGDPELKTADVRVIAATNQDLPNAVAERRFREDLYYRLNVLEVRIPALWEREEDILPLASSLLRGVCEKHGFEPTRLTAESKSALLNAAWPGNVRELANRLEAALLNAHLRGATSVAVEDLFDPASDKGFGAPEGWQDATRQFQRRHLLTVLEECDWNISEAARRLELTRTHVYNLMRDHQIERR